jgi:predicted phosphoadenosine phosphosulfate sulfurtransferase
MASDTKREEIQHQIIDWLSQEKDWQVVITKRDQERYYYFSCMAEVSKGLSCNVGIEGKLNV